MSAELLRRAADKLRLESDRAAHLGERWAVECDGPIAQRPGSALDVVAATWMQAAYVKTMAPAVGVALADWLDETARQINSYAENFSEGVERFDDLTEVDEAAHKVARAILREAP